MFSSSRLTVTFIYQQLSNQPDFWLKTINNFMQKRHTPLLQNIYETCKQIGLVKTQYEFSALCGRRTSWFSSNKTLDLPISTTAAYTLAVRLKEAAKTELPHKMRPHANAMAALLFAMINDRAKRKHEGQ